MLSLRPRAFVYEVVVFWPGASGERVHMTVMRLPPNITRTGTHVELAVMSKMIAEKALLQGVLPLFGVGIHSTSAKQRCPAISLATILEIRFCIESRKGFCTLRVDTVLIHLCTARLVAAHQSSLIAKRPDCKPQR